MLYFLHHLHEPNSWRLVLNLFRYVTFRAAAAGATSFLITVLLFPGLIRWLRAHGMVEDTSHPHSDFLTHAHEHKAGTPTMGGLGILAGILAAGLLWTDLTNRYAIVAMAATLAFGLVGAADDWMKARAIGKRGMSGKAKFALQAVIAAAVGLALVHCGGPVPGQHQPGQATTLYFPFVKPGLLALDLGLAYVAFAVLVIAGSSNAVNLTDGLDGLAAGCTAAAAFAYTALAYIAGHASFAGYLGVPSVPGAHELVILTAALAGAALAFLWYNSHPAEVFMGDAGSLAMGGLIGVVACAAKQELLLVIVGGVFVLEAATVIMQVGSYKLTGRRPFLVSPYHLHLLKKGWSENKIVVRFWILGIICAVMSVATLKVR